MVRGMRGKHMKVNAARVAGFEPDFTPALQLISTVQHILRVKS